MQRDTLNFFRGKRVLVTGATGFKGSWLALWLNELGAEVRGISLAPEKAEDHARVIELDRLVRLDEHDIRDGAGLAGLVADYRPEIVFHLAAQSLVRRSYKDPATTFETNVGGSVNLLEAVRATDSIRALIYVTSDKCYRNREWIWGYRENDELGGRDPYSASKAAAEIVFSAYLESFFRGRAGFGAGSVRAGNVIGGGDWAEDRIVPDCIRSLRIHAAIAVRNPRATRPWQHVLDPLSGYLSLARRLYDEPDRFSGPWNFGPDADAFRPVEDLVRLVIERWGDGKLCISPEDGAPHEAGLLHLNCDKAHMQLGWQPQWGFATAVSETVAWYRAVESGANPREVSLDQIRKYMSEKE